MGVSGKVCGQHPWGLSSEWFHLPVETGGKVCVCGWVGRFGKKE